MQKGSSREVKAGIVLHRTVSPTAQSTLNSFASGVGTHFLVGKDGAIYQTASLYTKTLHVRDGELFFANLSNSNLIGIEVVGEALDEDGNPSRVSKKETKSWEPLTDVQAQSVALLTNSLVKTYGLNNNQIYTHEGVQQKTAGEGQTVYNAIQIFINRQHDVPRPVEPDPPPPSSPTPPPAPPRAF